MSEMAAGCEIETEEGIARLKEGNEGGGIGRRTGMRLYVGEPTPEKLRNPFDRQPFSDVDILADAVITPAPQTFGIFVGEYRPLRLQHRLADDIFRCNQLDLVALAAEFETNGLCYFRVGF